MGRGEDSLSSVGPGGGSWCGLVCVLARRRVGMRVERICRGRDRRAAARVGVRRASMSFGMGEGAQMGAAVIVGVVGINWDGCVTGESINRSPHPAALHKICNAQQKVTGR